MESTNDTNKIIEDLSNNDSSVTKPTEEKVKLLAQQLKVIRNSQHTRFMNKNDLIKDDELENFDECQWSKGTICVIGDSIIQGLDEH